MGSTAESRLEMTVRRILVFSDLHANKRALMDIISVIKTVDLSIFCGDMLGYGTDIDYCIDFVLNNVDLVVLGDHERFAISGESLEKQLPAVRESSLFTRSKLSSKQIEAISSLPTEIWHNDIFVTHSIADDYLRSEADLEKLFERMHEDTKWGFFGHTHEQTLYKRGDQAVVNPGSITKGRRGFRRGYAIITDGDVQFINLKDIL